MKGQKEGKKEHIHTTELVVGPKQQKPSNPPHHVHITPPKMPERTPEHHLKHPLHRKGLLSEYIQSWKSIASLNFLLIVLYDLGFYAALYYLLFGYGVLINKIMAPFKDININSIIAQTPEQLGIYQQSISGTIAYVLLASIAFSLLFMLIWSLSRGLIWSRLLGRKISGRYIGKFYLLNMVWIIGWTLIFMIWALLFYKIGSASKVGGAALIATFIILYLLMTYLMYMLYYIFTTTDSMIWRSLRDAFARGIRFFTRLALPLLMLLGTILAIGIVSYVFKLLPQIVMEIISYILFFGVFAWMKLYAADILKERV